MISSSLTERFVITPALEIYDSKYPVRTVISEMVPRFIAAATSVVAAADLVIESASFALDKCKRTKAAPSAIHKQKMACFFKVMIGGSVAGLIYPELLRPLKPIPPLELIAEPIILPIEIESEENGLSFALTPTEASSLPFQMAQNIHLDNEFARFIEVKNFWDRCSLSDKSVFVQILSTDRSPRFAKARSELASMVYKPISNHEVLWLSNKQIAKACKRLCVNEEKMDTYCQAFYFHSTQKKNLEAILTTKKVEIRRGGPWKGAFVQASLPSSGYGKYILAFRRNIERLSPAYHGGFFTYAGFSQPIPVNEKTLAYIILETGNEAERAELELSCQRLTGRKISVFLLKEMEAYFSASNSLGLGVPSEWK